jgi:uncharacterized membrane protein
MRRSTSCSTAPRPGRPDLLHGTAPPSPRDSARDPWALMLAGLLTVTGVIHFVAPDVFNPIVPHALPGSAALWTGLSGAAELLLALGIAVPATRRVAATLTAIFLVLVFPANIQMAVDWASKSTAEVVIAWLRLPLQIPLIWWAWHVRTRTIRPGRAPTS